MDAGERRQPHVAGRFGLLDRELQRGGAGLVVTGLALRTPEAGELVGLRLQEAEPSRRLRRTTDVEDGIVEPMLDAGELAEHRVAANVEPRVVDHAAASARPDRAPRRRARDHRPRSRPGRRRASSRPDPTAGPARRRARCCDRSAPSPDRTRRDVTRRTRGSNSSAPAGRRRRSPRPAPWPRRRVRGRARGDPSTLRSTPRAAARLPDPGSGRRRRRRRAPPGSAARLGCRRGRSRPSRTR